MTRIIISLPENDKRWLDQYASLHGKSTEQVVYAAIKTFQKNTVLKKTAGILKNRTDAAKLVRELRNEWG